MTTVYRHVWVRGLLLVLLVLAAGLPLAAQGRRVVDIVRVGDAASEREHGYAGDDVTVGVTGSRAFKEARGWLSYSLAVYEDSDVTLSCVFRGTEGRKHAFDLLIEGRRVLRHTVVSPSSRPVSVDFLIPFEITKGLTAIHVMLRAVDGPAPALLELHTVQEHLELEPADEMSSVARGPVGAAF